MKKSIVVNLIFTGSLAVLFLTENPKISVGQSQEIKSSIKIETPSEQKIYDEYLDFFKKVLKTMHENYYFPIKEESFRHFIFMFNNKIFPQLKLERKSRDYIRWRSAAYLVEYLRDPEDIFSAFMPPKAAKTYEKEVLGQRIDLGIEGKLTPQGYRVSRIEPRSDAFEKGLREEDVILKIDGKGVLKLTEAKILELLTPLENAKVVINYYAQARKAEAVIEVICKEYFKQTVFMIPVDVPGIYCLQIQRFNRMTGDDLTRFMTDILEQNPKGLIIDLRDNPGGPPLAAREISAFFLTPKEEFAYFQMKNKPKAVLDVPEIPEKYRYHGNLVILVNKKSGSASELFSGILQGRRRALIMGTNTAGQVFLKSMFYFDDNSMVLLVTARGFHPDGTVFSFSGVTPDQKVETPNTNLIKYAADYLASLAEREKTK